MQNMWAREPERVKTMFARYPGQRNDLIKRLLFAGGLSGKRLRDAFGELCNKIIWEEANMEIFATSNGMIAADVDHIRNSIETHKPDVIICFGKTAWRGVRRVTDIRTFFAPHPAARIDDVMGKLRYTAEEVREYLKTNKTETLTCK